MWGLIFLAGILVFGLTVVYQISRLRRMAWIQRFSKDKRWRSWLLSAAVVFAAALCVGFWLGVVNLVIIGLHLSAIWLICDLGALVLKKICGKRIAPEWVGGAALFLSVFYLGIGFWLANDVQPVYYSLTTDKKLGNLRGIQLADAHIGTTFSGEKFGEYVADMQEENPDLVVITGDFVDDETSKEDMQAACRALGQLDTPYGVYYVYGNHDRGYFGDGYRGYGGNELKEELEKNGVVVLEDEAVLVDNRFYIIGRKDRSSYVTGLPRADMQSLISGLDTDKYMLVLDHQPADYEAEAASGVDLVLSGHTHGGQLLPLQWMMGMNDQVYGLEQRENTSFIVTSGISCWELQFKTGCRSEYVVITIRETS